MPGDRRRRGAAAQRTDAVRPGRRAQLRLGGAGGERGVARPDLRDVDLGVVPAAATSRGLRRSAQLDRLRGRASARSSARRPPPAGAFARVERAGRAWIAWLDPAPWAEVGSPAAEVAWCRRPGEARFRVRLPGPDRLLVRETRDPGWTALVDGRPAPLEPGGGPFLKIDIKSGEHDILLTYDPREVRIGLWLSACSLAGWILALTGFRRY